LVAFLTTPGQIPAPVLCGFSSTELLTTKQHKYMQGRFFDNMTTPSQARHEQDSWAQ